MAQISPSSKICCQCQASSQILYRVQWNIDRVWVFVCPQCWQIVSLDNPHYRYGGTWKQRQKI